MGKLSGVGSSRFLLSRPGLKGQGEGGARFGSGSVGDGGVASLQPQPTCALAESTLGHSYSDFFFPLADLFCRFACPGGWAWGGGGKVSPPVLLSSAEPLIGGTCQGFSLSASR